VTSAFLAALSAVVRAVEQGKIKWRN